MDRVKVILGKKFGPLTGMQWLLVAVVAGIVLYVVWRRRVEAQEEAFAEGEAGGEFTEGTTGEDYRGSSSALPFVDAGGGGYTAPAPYEGLTATEQESWFQAILDSLAPTEEEALGEEIPIGPGPGELAPWQQRIEGLQGRKAKITKRIARIRRGGVTAAERPKVRKAMAKRQQVRRRIRAVRQRHAGSVSS